MKKKFVRIICCVTIILIVAVSGCVAPPKDTPIETKTSSKTGNFFNPSSNEATTNVVPTHYIDPYPDALLLNSDYHIVNTLDDLRYPPSQYDKPTPTKNDVSIQIIRALFWDSYTVQKPTKYQIVGPSADKKFVIVAINIINYAGNQIIISPYPSNFELIYDGSRYSPTKLEYPIQGAGNSYKSEKIARLEKTGGVLVYEVPSSLTLDRSYIQLTYSDDEEQNPVWRLK
jgi:hypothetical protein